MTSRRAFPVMGTVCSIAVADSDVARLGTDAVSSALDSAAEELRLMDRRFSHYSADSDISRWSAGDDVGPEAGADIAYVLEQCERLRVDSGGAFDARDPQTGRLDTAGFVKGYAIRRAVGRLREHGLANVVLGVGGDAYCAGRAAPGRPWHVAVQDPSRQRAVVALVEATDIAVATSGRAQRGDHIWCGPGESASQLLSFTVTGPDIALADAYATIGFALGDAGTDWVADHPGYRSLAVRPDRTLAGDIAQLRAG